MKTSTLILVGAAAVGGVVLVLALKNKSKNDAIQATAPAGPPPPPPPPPVPSLDPIQAAHTVVDTAGNLAKKGLNIAVDAHKTAVKVLTFGLL